ncbi:MAG: hypothetical protein ABJZ03_09095 [Marinomonas sp.]
MMYYSTLALSLGSLFAAGSVAAHDQSVNAGPTAVSTAWICSFGDFADVSSGKGTPSKNIFIAMSGDADRPRIKNFVQIDPEDLLEGSIVTKFQKGDGKQIKTMLLTDDKALLVLKQQGSEGGYVSVIANKNELSNGASSAKYAGYCSQIFEEMTLLEMKELGNQILAKAAEEQQ